MFQNLILIFEILFLKGILPLDLDLSIYPKVKTWLVRFSCTQRRVQDSYSITLLLIIVVIASSCELLQIALSVGEDFGGPYPQRDGQEEQHPERVGDRAPEPRQEYAERLAHRQGGHHLRPEDRRGALHGHARRRAGALHQHQVHVRTRPSPITTVSSRSTHLDLHL